MTLAALYISLTMGIGSLTWGFYEGGYQRVAYALVGLGLLWALTPLRRWTVLSSLGLLATTAAAAAGLWLELNAGWMMVGALGGLLAWDLIDFSSRLRLAASEDDRASLERRHLARLVIIAMIGLMFTMGTLLLRLRLAFEWALVLALIAAWGISQLVTWLRRGGE